MPKICLADDFDNIDLGKMGKYLELPPGDAQKLIDTLRQVLTTEGIFLWSSGDVTDEKTAAGVILLNVVRVEILNHLLVDAPIEITWGIVKGAVEMSRIFLDPYGVSVVLDKFERETVKRAIAYGMNFLVGNEIRVTPGAIKFKYPSKYSGQKEVIFQYVIIYKPIDIKKGRVEIRFYMPDSIEPPDPNKFSKFLQVPNLQHNLSSFIVEIRGMVEKNELGNYRWINEKGEISHPFVEITFSDNVPDLGIKPLSRWEKYLLKPIETTIKEVEVVITKVTGKSPKLVDIWNEIKSFLAKISPFGPAAMVVEGPKIEEAEIEEEIEGVEEPAVEVRQEVRQSVGTVEVKPQPTPPQKLTLEEIQEKLDDIAERIDVVNQEMAKLTGVEVKPQQSQSTEEEIKKEIKKEAKEEEKEKEIEEEKIESEEKVSFCAINQSAILQRNKVIINEVAWMGTINSANDEWIELKNISGSEINLTGWQLLDKDSQIKIIFGRGRASVNGFFLLERTDDNSVPEVTADFIYTGGLNNSDEVLYLFDENCQLQDKVEANPDWSAGDNGFKKTMERKSDLSWQTSLNPGGTPKKENSSGYVKISTGGWSPPPPSYSKILISEIQTEGSKDFIELYNPSEQTANLSGYQLKKKTKTGSEYSIRLFPEGVTILAKSYLLWASSQDNYYQTVGADLFSSAYLSQDNSLAFFNKDKNIVDAVAWGENHVNPLKENTPFSQNPEENQTLGRKWNSQTQGYQDTDDNLLDFEIQFPTPKAQNQTFSDIIAPETTIDSKPLGLTNQIEAIFTFFSSEENSTFECKIDEENWQICFSPQQYSNLLHGLHTFQVRAKDISQNTDPIPAQYQWQIDTIPPQTEILTKPLSLTNQIQATFTFSSNEENSTFECKLDEGDWETCETAKLFSDLSNGEHTFSVRAKDAAGNLDSSPAQYVWTIDTSIESPTFSLADLDSNSSLYTNERKVKVTISHDEEATNWLLSESETAVQNPDFLWQSERPLEFILSEGDGLKTVYLWVKNESENISSGISAIIVLDTTPSAVQFGSLAPTQDSTNFTIGWSGQDSTSGILEYEIQYTTSPSDGVWIDWQKTSQTSAEFTGENGFTYYFKIRAKDNAGNLSDWSSEISTKIEQPILAVSPTSLDFEAIEFGQNPADKNLAIENTGFGDLNWEIVLPEPEVDWLNVSLASGKAPSGVSVSVNISGLEAGQFQATIEVSSNGGSKEIEVILNLEEDIIPPEPPQILSPQNNQIFNVANVTLAGATEPDALILISSSEIRADEEGRWQMEITLQEGPNLIEIKAKDEAGNESQPTTLNLLLDTHSPVVIINELPELEPSLSFIVSWSGNDSYDSLVTSGIDGFQLRYSDNGENWSYLLGEDAWSSETQYNFNGEDGKTYYFQVKARDKAGNESNWQETSTKISLPFPVLSVVINEIAWMGTKASSYGEWIELYNNNDEEIDLAGWGLFEGGGDTLIITLTKKISSKSYYLIERTTPSSPDPISDIIADDFSQFGGNGLSNNGEFLVLRDTYGNIIDSVNCSSGWFAGKNENLGTTENPNWIRISMERINSTSSGATSTDWANNNLITRNGKDKNGNNINGTPKEKNSVSNSPTTISDFPFSEFAEITLTYLGSPYIIQNNLTVPATKFLKIEPGVILKFNASVRMTVEGKLEAIGEEENKIIFTANSDSPPLNYWRGIYFQNSLGNKLQNIILRYGGKIYTPFSEPAIFWAALQVENSEISIKDSLIENSLPGGLWMVNSTATVEKVEFSNIKNSDSPFFHNTAAFWIDGGSPLIKNSKFRENTIGIKVTGSSTAQIENNIFEENETPIYLLGISYPVFSGNLAQNNNLNGILVDSSSIVADTVWQADLPYVIDGAKSINATLTLKAGGVVKIKPSSSPGSGYLEIYGKLITEGTPENPVLITSTTDSSETGWQRLVFHASGSVLDGAIIRYGGGGCSSGYCWGAITQLKDVEIEIKNSIIENNKWAIFSNENSCQNAREKINIENTIFRNNERNFARPYEDCLLPEP